jgi:hypothetical protein
MLAPVQRKCADDPRYRLARHGAYEIAESRGSGRRLASLTINFGLIDPIDGYTGFVDQLLA